MAYSKDIIILRDLAKQVADISHKDIQNQRRMLWRKHNSLEATRPLIYVRWFACSHEVIPQETLKCEDPFYRGYERFFRERIFQDYIGDDFIIEPWVTVNASYDTPTGSLRWGPEIKFIRTGMKGGAGRYDPPLKNPEDIKKLVKPRHAIDEKATAEKADKLRDAVGDILEVNVDRGPYYRMWNADLSTDLAYLRGLEQIMWDMSDRPQWLHELLAFMRDSVLEVHRQAEEEGDWRLCNHENQAMPYAKELADPRANSDSVHRGQLWCFMASQEFAQVSPEMFWEFMLQYQIPIAKKFGLVAYGCCEDLTRKIKYLKKIPNLRRIAVTPWADVRSCAEQIGQDYVLSWRPNPAEMICVGFEPDRIRKVVRSALEVFKENRSFVDIVLKDIETVQGKPENLREWTRIVRGIIEEYA